MQQQRILIVIFRNYICPTPPSKDLYAATPTQIFVTGVKFIRFFRIFPHPRGKSESQKQAGPLAFLYAYFSCYILPRILLKLRHLPRDFRINCETLFIVLKLLIRIINSQLFEVIAQNK